jgi:ankyrin repeat protein
MPSFSANNSSSIMKAMLISGQSSKSKVTTSNAPISQFIREQMAASMKKAAVKKLQQTQNYSDQSRSVAPSANASTGDQLHKMLSSLQASDPVESNLREVERILRSDPDAIRRSRVVYQLREVWSPTTRTLQHQRVKVAYTYPFHIALNNRNTPQPILRSLLNHASFRDALLLQDGSMKETAAVVFLRKRRDNELLDELLLANPSITELLDRHDNTALHTACQYGAALESIKHLYVLNPSALRLRNFHGQTPFDIVQKKRDVSEDIVNFFIQADNKGEEKL